MTTEMLRVELLHPIVLHFPIAFLFNAVFVRILLLIFSSGGWAKSLRVVYFWSLVVGTLGLFAAYLSGEAAGEIAGRLICDLSTLENHENFAKLTILFGLVTVCCAALVAFLTVRQEKVSLSESSGTIRLSAFTQAILGVEIFVLAATVVALSYTAHLGGSLVYQQGAGYLREPDPKCHDTVESLFGPSESTELLELHSKSLE